MKEVHFTNKGNGTDRFKVKFSYSMNVIQSFKVALKA